jgi:hypothetical protein
VHVQDIGHTWWRGTGTSAASHVFQRCRGINMCVCARAGRRKDWGSPLVGRAGYAGCIRAKCSHPPTPRVGPHVRGRTQRPPPRRHRHTQDWGVPALTQMGASRRRAL